MQAQFTCLTFLVAVSMITFGFNEPPQLLQTFFPPLQVVERLEAAFTVEPAEDVLDADVLGVGIESLRFPQHAMNVPSFHCLLKSIW